MNNPPIHPSSASSSGNHLPPGSIPPDAHASSPLSYPDPLEKQLDAAFSPDAVPLPPGLANRIYQTTAPMLAQRSPVLARIYSSFSQYPWRRLALAACLFLAVLLAVRFTGDHQSPSTSVSHTSTVSPTDSATVLASLHTELPVALAAVGESSTAFVSYTPAADVSAAMENDHSSAWADMEALETEFEAGLISLPDTTTG